MTSSSNFLPGLLSTDTLSNPNTLSQNNLGVAGFSINQFNPQASVRAPRGVVSIDGTPINWINWEVNTSGRSDTSTFKVTLPLGGTSGTLPLSYYVSSGQVLVEIQATGAGAPNNIVSSSQMDVLIIGYVDYLSYEPDKAILVLAGRDHGSKLIDKKTSVKYQNLTSAQIVNQIASNSGLTPVITNTQLLSGKYYQIDHARLTDQTSDWDLLQYLAREENYIAFVKGNNLYFQPQGTQTPYVIDLSSPGYTSSDPVVQQSNAVEIELTRNFVIGKGAKVSVHSWHLKSKRKVTSVSTAQGNNGEPLAFDYTYPNLSPDQAARRSKSKLHDITQHEFTLNIRMPADNLLNPQVPVQVIGTNSEFDQIYYVKSVQREMSFNQGYTMQFEAMNSAAKNTVTTS